MTLYELLFRTDYGVVVTVQVNICGQLFYYTQRCSCWLSDKFNEVLSYKVIGIRTQENGMRIEVIKN